MATTTPRTLSLFAGLSVEPNDPRAHNIHCLVVVSSRPMIVGKFCRRRRFMVAIFHGSLMHLNYAPERPGLFKAPILVHNYWIVQQTAEREVPPCGGAEDMA